MDARVRQALREDRTIDITTTGRRSGAPRRIEIWFHQLDGRLYITGLPGRRGWYANLLADQRLVFHLKQGAQADLAAIARPVADRAERQRIFGPLLRAIGRRDDPAEWVAHSPLVEVHLLAADPLATALAFIAALERADLETLRARCGPGFSFAGLGAEPLDVDGFVALEAAFHGAFDDVTYGPAPIAVEDDVAVVRIAVRARHIATFLDVPPTGRSIRLPPQIARYQVADGRVRHAALEPTPGAGVDGILAQLRGADPPS